MHNFHYEEQPHESRSRIILFLRILKLGFRTQRTKVHALKVGLRIGRFDEEAASAAPATPTPAAPCERCGAPALRSSYG